MQKMLQYALAYLKLGFSIIPAKGKIPLVPWKKYQEKKPTREDVIRWWTNFPEANIALITGKVSQIVVVDVDRETVPEFLTNVLTWKVRTKRGYHFYFKIDEAQNFQSIKLEGIDLKAEGGIVILPPSVHPDGERYKWEVFLKKLKEPCHFSKISHYIFSAESKPESSTNKLDSKLRDLYLGVPEGHRNVSMTRIAGSLFADGLTKKEVYEILKTINQRNTPPLEDEELRRIVNSIGFRQEKTITAINNILILLREGLENNFSLKEIAYKILAELDSNLALANGNRELALKAIGKNLMPLLYRLFQRYLDSK